MRIFADVDFEVEESLPHIVWSESILMHVSGWDSQFDIVSFRAFEIVKD